MSLPLPPSKPPVRVESREPKSVRFTASEWSQITAAALARGTEPSRFCRVLAIAGLKVLPGVEDAEAYVRTTLAETA